MSRGSDYDYDESFPNEAAFWNQRAKLARTSKRGKRALSELREALLALPERKLIEGALSTKGNVLDRCDHAWQREDVQHHVERQGEGVCAVGAFIWHKKVRAGMSADEAFDSLPVLTDGDSSLWETAEEGQKAGLTLTLAYLLADRNDETYRDCTPEERYERFLAWIDKELAAP